LNRPPFRPRHDATSRTRAAALALALAGLAPAARAEPPREAVERFERGVLLYKGGSPEAALVEFEAAHGLTGNYRILFNIALCRSETKDYAGALEAYRRYLADGGAQVDPVKRDDVAKQMQRLALFTGRVSVRTDAPARAEVLVDDRRAGTVPLATPLTVNAGARKVTVAAGPRVASKTIVVGSGDTVTVDLPLDPGPPPRAPAPSAPSVAPNAAPGPGAPLAPAPGADTRAFPWPFWAATGAFGTAAAVTGVLAARYRNDAARTQATFGARRDDIEGDQTRAERLGLATDVLLGAGLASAALGTYFTIRYVSRPGEAARAPAVRASFGPLGVSIAGTL
jgi:hypothetical protein